jgi:dolichyl-phosphate beta-glucosyltransferase
LCQNPIALIDVDLARQIFKPAIFTSRRPFSKEAEMVLQYPECLPFKPLVARKQRGADHALTLLIPAYNEERRLPKTLASAKLFLDEWGIDYRVIVIDNGSKDNTGLLAGNYGDRFTTIGQEVSGKGAAVRKGMQLATGSVIAFTDADLPYDLEALRRGYDLVSKGECSVVFGARDVEGARISVKRRLLRTFASSVFRAINQRLISRTITDTQCGLKIFSRAAADEVFSRTTIDGFAFDAEVVFLMHRLEISHFTVPVTLINEDGSTLSLTRHALPMLRDVLKIRLMEWRGQYQRDDQYEVPNESLRAPLRAA